jgi:hypothetical protein
MPSKWESVKDFIFDLDWASLAGIHDHQIPVTAEGQDQFLVMMSSWVLKATEVPEPSVSSVPLFKPFLSRDVGFHRVISPNIKFNRVVAGHAIPNACILIRAYVGC